MQQQEAPVLDGLNVLQQLYQPSDGLSKPRLDDLAYHFACFMGQLAASQDPTLLLSAALVSQGNTQGDSCLPLRGTRWRELLGWKVPEGFHPPLDWGRELLQFSVVGRAGEYRPLIVDHGRLYLYRYWLYEQRLSEALLSRATIDERVDHACLQAGIARLFQPFTPENAGQRVAAALAVLRRLAVISGGPGTGKTTTVLRILALLLEQQPKLRIGLAAPTGKAAARLLESLRQAKASLPMDDNVRAAIPEQAQTIHRLLGVKRQGGFHHHHQHPLALDVLVIDEASMVDLSLMTAVIDALPERTRLILLGDRDQLASVDAGAVLADIAQQEPHYDAELAQILTHVSGEPVLAHQGHSALAHSLALLRYSHRFDAERGIGALADAVNRGDAAAVVRLLFQAQHAELSWNQVQAGWETELRSQVVAAYRPYLEYLQTLQPDTVDASQAAQLWQLFNQLRLLCAQRQGEFGVERLNQLCQTWLTEEGLIKPNNEWYAGRPVMVTCNDYGLGLFNGDIGLCIGQELDTLRVLFLDSEGQPRCLLPLRVPQHDTVYAMTVHKSQGSEFERVQLLLGRTSSPLHTRELLYTGITRARQHVTLWASSEVLQLSSQRRTERASGLAARLWPHVRASAPESLG